ncbi:MAG TPA: aldo/keto reductase, partial [Enhygromyxa sp.]|nr:aldo/keto reductase [Enhygromyxa sp.]
MQPIVARGVEVPAFMYGTAWKEDDTARCVADAIAAGFRAIDTANQRKHYFEAGVGAGLERAYASGITRAELFLQTKFTYRRGQDHRLPYDPQADLATQVEQSVQSSLAHLGVERIDAYVLHGPATARRLIDLDWAVWRTMERLHDAGTLGLLGISNVELSHLQELCRGARIAPAFVQNRCYASSGWDREVRAFCAAQGIVYQGFSLLTANRSIFTNPRFVALQQRYNRTPAQLVFRFAQQLGMLPLTGTTDPEHMREDRQLDVDLDARDVEQLE